MVNRRRKMGRQKKANARCCGAMKVLPLCTDKERACESWSRETGKSQDENQSAFDESASVWN